MSNEKLTLFCNNPSAPPSPTGITNTPTNTPSFTGETKHPGGSADGWTFATDDNHIIYARPPSAIQKDMKDFGLICDDRMTEETATRLAYFLG